MLKVYFFNLNFIINIDDESQVGEDNDIDLEAFQRRRLLDGDEDNDWNITC